MENVADRPQAWESVGLCVCVRAHAGGAARVYRNL